MTTELMFASSASSTKMRMACGQRQELDRGTGEGMRGRRQARAVTHRLEDAIQVEHREERGGQRLGGGEELLPHDPTNQQWVTTRGPVAVWPHARTCENDAAGMSACVTGLVCPIWSDMHDILKSRSICSVKPARIARVTMGKSKRRVGWAGKRLQDASRLAAERKRACGQLLTRGVSIFVTTSMSAMVRHSNCAHPAWQNADATAKGNTHQAPS